MQKKTRKAQIVVAVIDESRQSYTFLLLRTNERRGNFWQNITGKIEENETYEDGGLREAVEETQLNIENIVDFINLGISHDFIDERKRDVHEKSFLIVTSTQWKVKIDPHEHDDYKWVALDEITPDSVKHKGNFEVLEKSISLLKQRGL